MWVLEKPQHLGSICDVCEVILHLRSSIFSWVSVSNCSLTNSLTILFLSFCTSMWPCNKYPLCHLTLNFVLCFSTELDVEDFDAFLEKVKARSLGNSPFACKFRLKLRNLWVNCFLHGSYNIRQTNKDFWRTKLQFSRTKIYSINCHSLTPSWTPYWD